MARWLRDEEMQQFVAVANLLTELFWWVSAGSAEGATISAVRGALGVNVWPRKKY